ncbi:hypothetical protein K439DRAFT_1617222 [Ramaria rubella]|nr:hypothetical protein K439DRAFT_1617222 [Ramaria rubella]
MSKKCFLLTEYSQSFTIPKFDKNASFFLILYSKNASKIQKRLKKVVQKGNIFGPFFPRPAKQAAQSPISESLMLTLGHIDAATRSNATGHTASLSVDHARMHDSSAPTRPLAPNATLLPTTRALRCRTHYGRPIGRAVIIETLSPPSLYPYVLARPHPMELSIVLSGQPSFSFSDRSPVVSYNVMSRLRMETLALDEVESTVLGDHASGVRYPLRYTGRTRFVYASASRTQCLRHNENLSKVNGVLYIGLAFHLSLQSGYQDNTQCFLSLS